MSTAADQETVGSTDTLATQRMLRRLTRATGLSRFSFVRDYVRILPLVRPHKQLVVASFAMIGVGVLASLAEPLPLALILDSVLGNKPLPALLGGLMDGWHKEAILAFAVLAGLAITAVSQGLGVVNEYVTTALEQRVALDFRSMLLKHSYTLSQTFHDRKRTGALMYQLQAEADAAGTITVSIPPLIQALATLVGMFVIVYRIDPEIALISLTVVPLIYYSTGFYATKIQPRLLYVRNLEGESISIIHEAIQMLRVVVAFGREKHEFDRFRRQGEAAVNARVDLTVRQTIFSMAVALITAGGTALVLGFGGLKALHGGLTPGELVIVLSYVAAVYQPLQQIADTLSHLQQQFVALRNSMRLLDTKPEIAERPDAVALTGVGGRVVFDRVSFTYRGRKRTLDDISFDICPGSRVGIVGPTGAGKSTLVALISRFYDPEEGRILLDEHDTRDVTLESLRRNVAIVHQEPMLFSGTIADNIRYGRLEASDEGIREAARAANADRFISALPKEYSTVLGERGAQLSGGERQRICVARAFLKDAPVLVLDEPTSSIDSRTEEVILDALERLMVGRTTFMIAHRLSTLRDPDLILVLDGGRIVQRGTHAELTASDGLYSELWAAQIRADRRELTRSVHMSLAARHGELLRERPERLRERALDLIGRGPNGSTGADAAFAHAASETE
jgi:ABC-type multidrug transport system fused ATPase/permease subunit